MNPDNHGSTISQPAKCKLCGAVLGHFALAAPDSPDFGSPFNQEEYGRLGKAIAQHMQTRAQTAATIPTVHGRSTAQFREAEAEALKRVEMDRHGQALMAAANLGGNLTQSFLWRHFELPKGAQAFQEQTRAGIHHMMSNFTLTERMAEELAQAMLHNLNQKYLHYPNTPWQAEAVAELKAAFLALAARYEEGHPKEPAAASQRVQ